MITLLELKKFLLWANLGLYHKNKPLEQLEVQNDTPHYKISDISEVELVNILLDFNKRIENEQI
tara:strand:+ start:974 stop:1165 length:192 start_codon:yes stop_codon:yes gene_type:complete